MTKLLPLRSSEEHEKLRRLIESDPLPLDVLFMMDAWRDARIGHELQALTGAITALEIALPKSPPGLWERFRALIKGKKPLQVVVRDMLRSRKAEQKTIDLVIGAIRDRNRIVHEGMREITTDIQKYLTEIDRAISILKIPPNPPPRLGS